jgi:hypothetical protein
MNHPRLNRLLASLLPISFFWLFVACVTACDHESAWWRDQPASSPSIGKTQIKNVPECEGCSVESFPQAAPVERSSFKVSLQAPPDATTVALSILAGDTLRNGSGHLPTFSLPPPDDPLQLLPTLRI